MKKIQGKLKVGIIGSGGIMNWHVDRLKGTPSELVALMDTSKEALAKLSLRKGEISGNLGEMVANAGKIAFVSFYFGPNCTNIDIPIVAWHSTNSYRTVMPVLTTY